MRESTTMPTFFGRATAVVADHERLRLATDRLRALGSALRDAFSEELEPRALLEEFRGQIAEHFAAEESDGYFGELATELPSLNAHVGRLRTDHRRMLELTNDLLRLADDEAGYVELAGGITRLLDHLRSHEHAENLLLQEYFLRDDRGGGD